MAQSGPRMTQYDPKWPKKDLHFFRNFFLTEKAVPQTFSLLECMGLSGKASDGDDENSNPPLLGFFQFHPGSNYNFFRGGAIKIPQIS